VITELALYDFKNKTGNVALSVFGDGAFVLSFQRTF
jgi:hypothetical protein